MSRTLRVNVELINSSELNVDLVAKYGKDDWEIQPKFPGSLGSSTIDSVWGEAFYYRKTVPITLEITIDNVVLSFTHDPYKPENQYGQQQITNGTVGYVCTQREDYGFQIVIWSTRHSAD